MMEREEEEEGGELRHGEHSDVLTCRKSIQGWVPNSESCGVDPAL